MSAVEPGRVYAMDALQLLGQLADGCIDLILTSPPYDNLRTYNGYTWDFEGIARESYRVLKPGGVLVWVVGDSVVDGSETLTSFRQALYFKECVGFRMHDTMIWQKQGAQYPETTRYWQEFEYMFVLSKGAPKKTQLVTQKNRWHEPARKRPNTTRQADGSLEGKQYQKDNAVRPMGNIWQFGSGFGKSTHDKVAFEHPATFPEKLAERHILTWTNPGDVVLDYFGGSGTTAKMARNNGRQWITGDISAEYVDLMRRRLAQPFTPNMFEALPVASGAGGHEP